MQIFSVHGRWKGEMCGEHRKPLFSQEWLEKKKKKKVKGPDVISTGGTSVYLIYTILPYILFSWKLVSKFYEIWLEMITPYNICKKFQSANYEYFHPSKWQLLTLKESTSCTGALQVLVYLMLALHSPALVADRLTALNILHALMSNTKIVKEALNKGTIDYITLFFAMMY